MKSGILPLALLAALGHAQTRDAAPAVGVAKGTVFEDKNRNGVRDRGERGIAGVKVSNQLQVAVTDRQGRWQLPYSDETIFFVVKPRDWMPPVDKDQRPQFFYIHKPKGSPQGLRFKGVDPTGPLPASIDFPLHRKKEDTAFRALFFGDTQPRDLREVDYLARDIIEPLVNSKEKFDFGVTLGDIVFDDLSVTEPLVQAIGLIGIPWYYVLGNHDINFDVPDDEHSDEHWEKTFGPNYYSFQHGPTHFVVLDNVVWIGKENAQKLDPARTGGFYRAGLGKKQLEWLKNDLAKVPANQLVVFMMHIPITENEDKAELFQLIAERPYALSVSAHTHFQEHRFLTKQDGWPKAEPHHHVVNVTTCGSWWTGAPDPRGVPHTTMRDGAPHGYSVFTFDGNQYKIEYRAARRPADYQMNVIAPESLASSKVGGTVIYANVFGGSDRSKVEYSFAGSAWAPMTQSREFDPDYVKVVARDAKLERPFRPLPGPVASPHLWKTTLAGNLRPGVYPLHVRTTDMFGQTYLTTRAIRIVD